MDINGLLNGVQCECGKLHTCDIRYVYIESGAISRLREICKDYNNVLIVADENTFSAAGELTLNALNGKTVERVIFSGDEILVPDENAVNTVTENLGNAEIIIGIGSGVIQDLCKYISFCNNLPYIIVATAPSMDGYASDGAAMILGGMKVTKAAGLPIAIIGDVDVLKNAPFDMLKAGYGDIIGKFSALNDWKLSHIVNGEYFCDYIYNVTYSQIEATLELADGIVKRNEKSIEALMKALVVIGIMMSFAGSSRPASGSEHHFSHFFEITGIVDNEEYFPHGIDVGYSTVITCELRQKLRSLPFGDKVCRLSDEDYRNKVNEIYKSVADGCVELQERVGFYKKDLSAVYTEKEAEIKRILSETPTADEIKQMLAKVGLDINEFYSLYSEQKIKDATLYAKDLKDRYTVLWLYYDYCLGVE